MLLLTVNPKISAILLSSFCLSNSPTYQSIKVTYLNNQHTYPLDFVTFIFY